ncbi:MAG: phosphoribosyltransferase family protein, partial [archaeon]
MKKHLIEAKRIMKEESDYLIPGNSDVFKKIVNDLARPFKNKQITKVVAVDMKGLMYGSAVAYKLGVSFVPILKGGKIKNSDRVLETKKIIDYSGKEKYFEAFKNSINKKDKVLLVDDWFESGNTGKEIIKLIETLGGRVVGISVLLN